MISKIKSFFTGHFLKLWLVCLHLVVGWFAFWGGQEGLCHLCGSFLGQLISFGSPLLHKRHRCSVPTPKRPARLGWRRRRSGEREVRTLPHIWVLCPLATPQVALGPLTATSDPTSQQELGMGASSCHGLRLLAAGHRNKRWDI